MMMRSVFSGDRVLKHFAAVPAPNLASLCCAQRFCSRGCHQITNSSAAAISLPGGVLVAEK
jgi:hypothetical protein